MLQPKKTKFRKAHKGRIKGNAKGGTTLNFGSYGLKAITAERVTARQIEAARRAITRHMKGAGRVWISQLLLSGRWQEVRRWRWRRLAHINLLECSVIRHWLLDLAGKV